MVSRSTAWPARPTASAPAPTQMLGVPPLLWLYIVLNGVGAGPRTALLFVGIIGYLGDVLGGGAFFCVDGEHGQPLKDPHCRGYRSQTEGVAEFPSDCQDFRRGRIMKRVRTGRS